MSTETLPWNSSGSFAPDLEFRDDGSWKPEPYKRKASPRYPVEIPGTRDSDWAKGWMKEACDRAGAEGYGCGDRREESCCASCSDGLQCDGGGRLPSGIGSERKSLVAEFHDALDEDGGLGAGDGTGNGGGGRAVFGCCKLDTGPPLTLMSLPGSHAMLNPDNDVAACEAVGGVWDHDLCPELVSPSDCCVEVFCYTLSMQPLFDKWVYSNDKLTNKKSRRKKLRARNLNLHNRKFIHCVIEVTTCDFETHSYELGSNASGAPHEKNKKKGWSYGSRGKTYSVYKDWRDPIGVLPPVSPPGEVPHRVATDPNTGRKDRMYSYGKKCYPCSDLESPGEPTRCDCIDEAAVTYPKDTMKFVPVNPNNYPASTSNTFVTATLEACGIPIVFKTRKGEMPSGAGAQRRWSGKNMKWLDRMKKKWS